MQNWMIYYISVRTCIILDYITLDSTSSWRKKNISTLITEESYTSKCSFIDKEKICKHREYIGERTKRGMFVSPQWEINADVNAALNIIRKKVSDEAVYTLIGRGKWQFPTRINCA